MKILILISILLLTTYAYAEKIVLYDKVNQAYVNDFQSEATEETLINNAIKSGGNKVDFEIRKVSDEDFIKLEKEVNENTRIEKSALAKQEALDKEFKKQKILEKIGITKQELEEILK